ncbi:uncharacterized protein [Clytia hemisphaerica]|uniref:FAD-binding PCMH-type domain-containing protein n=1 Tax=Clytia hemisphaerica TaxID=252671 RepID=A0A7M5WME5_9CNID
METLLAMLLMFMVLIPARKVYGDTTVKVAKGKKCVHPPIGIKCYSKPGDGCWPSGDDWEGLNKTLNGNLKDPVNPISACFKPAGETDAMSKEREAECSQQLQDFKSDPYWVRKHSGLTQSAGQVGAWNSTESVKVVEARTVAHIKTAVDFARKHNMRIVVKGTGHEYNGRSNAPDSLLIWTYHMSEIIFHDQLSWDCPACKDEKVTSVTVGAGVVWGDIYAAANRKNLYVQGGTCPTVGVVGFTLGGGIGIWSRKYGLGSTNLLQATVVTADGDIKRASKVENPELYYALRGGGFGFGIVADMTIRTHPSPKQVILVKGDISTYCESSFKKLLAHFFTIYKEDLVGPHWGDYARVKVPGKHSGEKYKWVLSINMKAVDISLETAKREWASFIRFVSIGDLSHMYKFEKSKYDVLKFLTMPGNTFWSRANPGTVPTLQDEFEPHAAYNWGTELDKGSEQFKYWLQFGTRNLRNDQILTDPTTGADKLITFFKELGDLPSTARLSMVFKGEDNIFNCASNELANTPMARMNESFAMIWAWVGVRRFHPDIPISLQKDSKNTTYTEIKDEFCKGNSLEACPASKKVQKAFQKFREATPGAGSYFNIADYFEKDFKEAFWGKEIYKKLRKLKDKYDPHGLFYCHHCVGSEDWEYKSEKLCKKGPANEETAQKAPTPNNEEL